MVLRGFVGKELCVGLFVTTSLVTSLVAAQPTPKAATTSAASTGGASTSAGAAKPAEAGGVRRDPKGVSGISPFTEAVVRGDRLYLAQDFDGAKREYQAAITLEPTRAAGHLRLAEVLLRQADRAGAEAALQAALRYSGGGAGGDTQTKGRATFLLALLKEQARAWPDATAAWQDYATLAASPPVAAPASGSPASKPALVTAAPHGATAEARKAAIEARKKAESDAALVKERIAKRLEEAQSGTAAKK